MIKTYEVNGMTCVICKKNVEKALSELDGVNLARVNLIDNEVEIDFDETKTDETIFYKTLKNAGYTLVTNKKSEINIQKIKLSASIFLTLVLMLIAMTNMHQLTWHIILIQFIISTIILLLNINIYFSGFKSLFKLSPNMNSLVGLSSFVSYVYSIYASIKILNGNSNYHLYFETATMVIVIVTIGKYIERNTKAKTNKVVRGLSTLIPMQANVINEDDTTSIVPINDLKKGNIVRVFPGESIPQDGVIIKGYSSIDESMITGESLKVNKTIDDEVIGGTININGTIDIKITKSSNMSVISNIINLTKQATMSKVPIERLADKISKYFVFIVIGISLSTFIIWIIITKNIELALNFSLSVLVVSCPCALGLATPVSIAAATNLAARHGILIKKAEVLEIIHKAKTIIFDKTGTLTNNKLEIVDEIILNDGFINVLSSIEKNSKHPIAVSINEKYKDGDIKFDTCEFIAGEGLKATLNNDIYLAGNEKLIKDIDSKYIKYAKDNNFSFIAVKRNNEILGIVYLADVIRETSKKAIINLEKRHIKSIMCTGDNEIAAKVIADKLNIKEYQASVKPIDKNDLVIKEKENGIVMMVGDGVNDALALSNSDVSITIKNASDIASASSDVVLMKSDLNDINFLYDISNKTIKIIKQNLIWALGYNTILIPIGAGVLYTSLNIKLTPIMGSIAMWISSMFVLLNALRINNVKKED